MRPAEQMTLEEGTRPSCTARPAAWTTRTGMTGWQFYAPEVEFWMPSWDDDDELTEDPQREISLIYYAHRGGLEDRVFRIKTERSSATSARAPHQAQHQQRGDPRAGRSSIERLRFNWAHAQLSLQDRLYLFRHLALHDRHQRRSRP